MVLLTIFHNIFVTDEQRLALARGQQIEVIGISVPVWYNEGSTSEPAHEVFCKYILTNVPSISPPTPLAQGYQFNLPQVPEGYLMPKRPAFKDLEEMSKAEIDAWYKENVIPPTGADLLDPQEGGLGYLFFKDHVKIVEENKRMNVVHIVEISPIKALEESIV